MMDVMSIEHETKEMTPSFEEDEPNNSPHRPNMNQRPRRFVTNVIEEHVHRQSDSVELKQDTKPSYSFGVKFSYYTEYSKLYPSYEYVESKYENQKEELLYNQISGGTVKIDQWNEIYEKAEQRYNQREIRQIRAMDDPMWNRLTGIEAHSQITREHIVSMLFYTDFDDLPRNLKTACRRQYAEENAEKVRDRHCQVTHWLRLLFECVMVFGKAFTNKSIDVYHGLDKKFLFSEFKARYIIVIHDVVFVTN